MAIARERAAYYSNEATIHGASVTAYRLALSAFDDATTEEVAQARAQTASTPRHVASEEQPITRAVRPREKAAGIPGGAKWAQIFARVAQDAASPYGYSDLEKATLDLGHNITLGAMRAQMMSAVNAGLFEREGAGKFVMTDLGLELITAPPENAASVGAAEANTGEAAGSPGVLDSNHAPVGQ